MSFDLTGMDGGVGKQNCFYMWRMSLVEGYKEGLTRDCGKSDRLCCLNVVLLGCCGSLGGLMGTRC